MSLNDPLANALSLILNAEKVGKRMCVIKPHSTILKKLFSIMQAHQYLGEIKEFDDGKGGYLQVQLNGTINQCGVIKPRFSVKLAEYEKFEQRYLPGKDFGILIISTPKGIMIHTEAKKQKLGGRLLMYCY